MFSDDENAVVQRLRSAENLVEARMKITGDVDATCEKVVKVAAKFLIDQFEDEERELEDNGYK